MPGAAATPKRVANMKKIRYDVTGMKHPKNKKPRGPNISKERFLLALEGSGGIFTRIAKKLDVTRAAVKARLELSEWSDMREAWEQEYATLGDDSLECIRFTVNQRDDLKSASSTARWWLATNFPDQFGKEKTIRIEGGKTPVQIQHNGSLVDIKSLNLPLDTLRSLMKSLEPPKGIPEKPRLITKKKKKLTLRKKKK